MPLPAISVAVNPPVTLVNSVMVPCVADRVTVKLLVVGSDESVSEMPLIVVPAELPTKVAVVGAVTGQRADGADRHRGRLAIAMRVTGRKVQRVRDR